MPVYDFKCKKCEMIKANVVLPIHHRNSEIPMCCGDTMRYHITSAPLVHWRDPVIAPFRSTATKDTPVITTTRERREYMARNDLVDASDMRPPTHDEQKKEAAKMMESIQAISPSGSLKKQMQEMGLDSPTEL